MTRLGGFTAALACAMAAGCSGAPPRAAAPIEALPAQPAQPAQGNPFEGADFYVDPAYSTQVESTVRVTPARSAQLRKLESVPTAIWLDSIAAVGGVARALDDALARQRQSGKPVVTVLVVYDLPERDCAASASSGELAQSAGGEGRYETEFIEPLAAQLRAHASQRVVVVVEPDSLANIATNGSIAKCAAADGVYRRSIAMAIRRLSMPSVWLYLDAAHAAWLGWTRNRAKIAQIYRDVLTQAGGLDKVRGFATNVSNYDTLRGGDIARLEPSDPCPDELTYVEKLGASLAEVGIVGKGFLVDTSRNGRAGIRSKSGSWCNVKGAGLGERPQASPVAGVDAYWWIKPPGASDGGSDPASPGYDPNCGAADSLPGAPRAGQWFDAQLLQLVDNANPPL
ncbi:MAG TPA: glycoside hydrolase family 6 protein [Polyangiaceae bacterium]|nr:glycoside hydrolase family 6 protein [Polyangiaceae bacterium]